MDNIRLVIKHFNILLFANDVNCLKKLIQLSDSITLQGHLITL